MRIAQAPFHIFLIPAVLVKAFNWSNPYPTMRIPVFARNVVSTSSVAAQAARMMLAGGNAVDAAIAAAAAIT